MARKGGLGKGLEALIPGDDEISAGGSNFVAISRITPNPRQPRQDLLEEGLQELAASIREHGVIQPLIVSQEAGTANFTLIAGERRLRAALIAGLEAVPVIVRQVDEQERLELALIENLQRTDLSPLETAEAYRQLSEEFGLSHEEVADRVGKSRSAVTNTLRLLRLPVSVQNALSSDQISEGHARTLLALATAQAQTAVLQTILKNNLNVRQTEELVRRMSGEKPTRSKRPAATGEVHDLEERLRSFLGTRVSLNHGTKGGSLVIYFYSDEELSNLVQRITRE